MGEGFGAVVDGMVCAGDFADSIGEGRQFRVYRGCISSGLLRGQHVVVKRLKNPSLELVLVNLPSAVSLCPRISFVSSTSRQSAVTHR